MKKASITLKGAVALTKEQMKQIKGGNMQVCTITCETQDGRTDYHVESSDCPHDDLICNTGDTVISCDCYYVIPVY